MLPWISEVGTGKYFTTEKQQFNAKLFYQFFVVKGVTLAAICGMLGNISWESTLNPGIKQGESTYLGWGLIQWTPSTVITNWCDTYGYNWWDGNAQCERIWSEGIEDKGAGGTWIPTAEYPYSWQEFIQLSDLHECVLAYLRERERAGTEKLEERLTYANYWYTYFTDNPPPTPGKPKRRLPIYMMINRRL